MSQPYRTAPPLDFVADVPRKAPTWLSSPQGRAFLEAYGLQQDAHTEVAKEATKARLPSLGSPDALGAQAADRGLEQFIGESEFDFRARLAASFDELQLLGTPTGVTEAIGAVAGVVTLSYREAWQVDPASPRWARWWALVWVSWPRAPVFDDGVTVWDGGETFDFIAGEAGPLLYRQIRRWKAAHTCARLLITDPTVAVTDDPTQTETGGWAWPDGLVAVLEV